MGEDEKKRNVQLQVLICTYGNDGINRVVAGNHPKVEGVEYIVSWQINGPNEIPKALLRDDFRVFTSPTKGLSINRNIALSKAEAPILLISDDDVEYTPERLLSIIEKFEEYNDQDIITFRYESSNNVKKYPSSKCYLSNPTKGYYVTSFEIAFRKDAVKGKIWFNENFGIGAKFPSGEEDVFIKDCLDAGLKGIFIPMTIVTHESSTTSQRNLTFASRPQTKGAVFLRLHPYSWPLRMLAHAAREIPLWKKGLAPSPISYCVNWLRGSIKAKKAKVFPTPDYTNKYS